MKLIYSKLVSLVSRLAYGAFIEKRWHVSVVPHRAGVSPAERFRLATEGNNLPTVDLPLQYSFLADPFFYDSGKILAEALHRTSGKGQIVAIENGKAVPLISSVACHLSYPFTVEDGDRTYIVPEMARGGSPQVFALSRDTLVVVRPLEIDSGPLLDPTFFWHESRLYLFANRAQEGSGLLRLWSAGGLFDYFEEHPASPIRIDKRGSRMGGRIFFDGESLYRLGQDFYQSYGDGLLCFRIDCLSPTHYSETLDDTIALRTVKGPHTLDIRGEQIVFDWYEERFSLLAWARRIAARLG